MRKRSNTTGCMQMDWFLSFSALVFSTLPLEAEEQGHGSMAQILGMTKSQITYLCPSLFLVAQLFHFSNADVGTAGSYRAPYIPSAAACKINPSQFPLHNMVAAAGVGLWNNGASCGKQYLVRCIGASVPDTCRQDKTIQVTIVDQAQPSMAGAIMILSTTAFNAIANGAGTTINIEYQDKTLIGAVGVSISLSSGVCHFLKREDGVGEEANRMEYVGEDKGSVVL
ncbi:hypothetical protein FNV43_RR12353 [Rhamnella rubrinervis]|uniref:Expansin-like EG45 domain-containing protein n=1 Tax=Rhamnella rubrinervis TaxID=2594499 RepID=A0A8K0MIR1_9ROSA|nr:hypothetical protein FNV43_RR12353 [Rhamnella rubrinervis]